MTYAQAINWYYNYSCHFGITQSIIIKNSYENIDYFWYYIRFFSFHCLLNKFDRSFKFFDWNNHVPSANKIVISSPMAEMFPIFSQFAPSCQKFDV